MTNAESYLKTAKEKLEKGELNSYESLFIESIQYFTKKELKKLTSNQFLLLRKIANS
jgi:hypothetical protein